MTPPRRVVPGTTYLVTRRCTQRQFLLKPCKMVNELFLYVLALAAARYGIQVHAFCVLSNHFHLILTDPNAVLPAFQQFLDSLLARALNCFHGRWEHFWAPDSYSAVVLTSPSDILDKVAYVLANPAAAGLVPHGSQWPGLWSSPEQIGTTIEARRPDVFFSKNGNLPEKLSLSITPPPGFASVDDFRERLTVALEAREEQAARDLEGRFLGVAKILAQRPTDRPKTAEPRRGLNPRVAARDKWKRIEILGQLKGFLESYEEALQRWREVIRDTIFPYGTYLMRVLHGALCAAPG